MFLLNYLTFRWNLKWNCKLKYKFHLYSPLSGIKMRFLDGGGASSANSTTNDLVIRLWRHKCLGFVTSVNNFEYPPCFINDSEFKFYANDSNWCHKIDCVMHLSILRCNLSICFANHYTVGDTEDRCDH